MKAPMKKAKVVAKSKAAPVKAKKAVAAKKAAPKSVKKPVLAKAPRKSPPKERTREREIEAPNSLFLNPEVSPAHQPGHRRINLKENAASKPGRPSAR